MTVAKVEIKVGAVSFSGEGEEGWLTHQLDKVLAKLPELLDVHVDVGDEKMGGGKDPAEPTVATHHPGHKGAALAAYLKEKKATSNQTRKFLAAALWLQDVKGQKRVATGEVSKALNDHNQGKLTNPAQCLASNSTQGLVVRDGKQFYVTEEGRAELDK